MRKICNHCKRTYDVTEACKDCQWPKFQGYPTAYDGPRNFSVKELKQLLEVIK